MDKEQEYIEYTCPQCGGSGHYVTEVQARYGYDGDDTCNMCKGTGVYRIIITETEDNDETH